MFCIQRGGVSNQNTLTLPHQCTALLQFLQFAVKRCAANVQPGGQLSHGARQQDLAALIHLAHQPCAQLLLPGALDQGVDLAGEKADAAGEVADIAAAKDRLGVDELLHGLL